MVSTRYSVSSTKWQTTTKPHYCRRSDDEDIPVPLLCSYAGLGVTDPCPVPSLHAGGVLDYLSFQSPNLSVVFTSRELLLQAFFFITVANFVKQFVLAQAVLAVSSILIHLSFLLVSSRVLFFYSKFSFL